MELPLLGLVSGAPATGKTTLALRLGQGLKLPVLLKDAIKEKLLDTLGAPDRARSRELGVASYAVLYDMAARLLDAGVGAVVESNFGRGQSERGLRPLTARSRAVLLHCFTSHEEIVQRYSGRHASSNGTMVTTMALLCTKLSPTCRPAISMRHWTWPSLPA